MKGPEIIQFLCDNTIKLATVSGIWTTRADIIERVDRTAAAVDVITTKSYQVKPNPGNREPIIAEADAGSYVNAVGLRNPGMEKGCRELRRLRERHRMRCLLNVSLSASSTEDFIALVEHFQETADLIELNYSCPHAKEGYGASIGSSPEAVKAFTAAIRRHTSRLLFAKLTPNVENIGDIACAALEGGADGISAINTVGPVLHREPHTGEAVLYNKKGGGKSGRWIREMAIEKISCIREAIGGDIPLIGMGGVSTGADVRRLQEAGANVVGLGSAFALVAPELRADYCAALKRDASLGSQQADTYLAAHRMMEYRPFKIAAIKEQGSDLRIFTLTGSLGLQASRASLSGQFAFLWVPGAGEKPFSIVSNNPLTFLVRKRDYDALASRGLVSHALFQMKTGQELMVRGPYGREAPVTGRKQVVIVAGGTGIAVVPELVRRLQASQAEVEVFYGVKRQQEIVFAEWIKAHARLVTVEDNGVTGRVLAVLEQELTSRECRHLAFYNIGPPALMKKAMEIEERCGGEGEFIYSCLETTTLCGVGLCGECECGGMLTCREGSFYSLAFLQSRQIDISAIGENYD